MNEFLDTLRFPIRAMVGSFGLRWISVIMWNEIRTHSLPEVSGQIVIW